MAQHNRLCWNSLYLPYSCIRLDEVPPKPVRSYWLDHSPTFSESEKLEITSFGKHKPHELYGPIN